MCFFPQGKKRLPDYSYNLPRGKISCQGEQAEAGPSQLIPPHPALLPRGEKEIKPFMQRSDLRHLCQISTINAQVQGHSE